MKKPTEDDNFNWVEARNNCSMAKEFEALKQTVEANVKDRQAQLGAGSRLQLTDRDSNEFMVVRDSPFKVAVFRREGHKNRILVENNNGEKQLELTPFLNDDGECRFKVDGEGDFLRWQIARKALEDILF